MTDKRRYKVKDGVEHVAGAKVPEDRIVSMTEAEALYERGLGRIELATPPRKPKANSGEGDD